jgi:hypothetical protein
MMAATRITAEHGRIVGFWHELAVQPYGLALPFMEEDRTCDSAGAEGSV